MAFFDSYDRLFDFEFNLAHERRVKSVLFISLFAFSLLSSSAYAEHSVALKCEGEVGSCPNCEELGELVSARLGYQAISSSSNERIEVVYREVGDNRVSATIRHFRHEKVIGERSLPADDFACADLSEELEMAIALLVEPEQSEPTPEPTPVEQPSPSPIVESKPEPALPPQTIESPSKLAIRGTFGGGLHSSLLPKRGAGFNLMVGFSWENLLLELGGRFDLPTTTSFGEGEIETSMLAASLRICGQLSIFELCAAADVGTLRSEGKGYAIDRRNTDTSVSLGPTLGAEWRFIDSLGAHLRFSMPIALARTTILVEDDVAWRTPSVGFRVEVEMIWHLWTNQAAE